MGKFKVEIYKKTYKMNNIWFYIGSTKNKTTRGYEHKYHMNIDNLTKQHYGKKMRDFIGKTNCKDCDFETIIIDSKWVNNRTEQVQFEQEWMDKLKPTLNTIRAYGQCPEKIKLWIKRGNVKNKPKHIKKRTEENKKINEKYIRKEVGHKFRLRIPKHEVCNYYDTLGEAKYWRSYYTLFD